MAKRIIVELFCTVVGGIILFVIIERVVRPYIHVSDTPPENLSKQPAHAPIKQSGATVPPPANSKAPTRLAAQKREELLREMERRSQERPLLDWLRKTPPSKRFDLNS